MCRMRIVFESEEVWRRWRVNMENVRHVNRGCIRQKGVTKCWQLILDTCLDGQPVKSSEKGWNMISFMSFEDESRTFRNFSGCWGQPERNELPREDKGGHRCFCRVNGKKTPNGAETAKFSAGRSADSLYVLRFCHLWCRNQDFWQKKKKKKILQPQTKMVASLETEKDLEDERMRRASVLSLLSFKFVFQHPGLDVWETGFQRIVCRLNVWLRNRNLQSSIIRKRLRVDRVTLN